MAQDVPAPPAPETPPPPPPPPRRRWTPFWLVAIAVAVVLVAGAIFFVTTRDDAGTSTTTASATTGPPRVAGLTARAVSPVKVELEWTASGSIREFIIFRNGTRVETEPKAITRFEDFGLQPGHEYTYAVAAADYSGRESARVQATVVTPPPPPVATARLEGSFVVKAKFVSETYTNFHVGQVQTQTWRFTPDCDSGSCRVKVNLYAPAQHFPLMNHKGSKYAVKGTAQIGRCGSSKLVVTITINIHVTKARYVAGKWTATAFEGTVLGHTPPTFGCLAGSSKQRVTGTLQR